MELNNNKQRRAYWQSVKDRHSELEIQHALNNLPADTARVLHLHYEGELPLKDIAMIMERSISVIRNHHNRGIYKLWQQFQHNTKGTLGAR